MKKYTGSSPPASKKKAIMMDKRERLVSKSNELIQKGRFSLSASQQRLLIYLIAHIDPTLDHFEPVELGIREYLDVCGSSTNNYATIRRDIKALADQSFWLSSRGRDELHRWLSSDPMPTVNEGKGTITLCLSENMREHLLQLYMKGNYTKYQMLWILSLHSKYSIRLYEYLWSRLYNKFEKYEFEISLLELQAVMGAEKYANYGTFKQRVFNPSVAEINAYTDVSVTYTECKTGRSVSSIFFSVLPTIDSITGLELDIRAQQALNRSVFPSPPGKDEEQ